MDKSTESTGLVYKEINYEDIEEISAFLNRIFNTNKFTAKYLNKIYFEKNLVIGYNVFNGPKLVAHYCVLKREYKHLQNEYTIGWSVNTAVDPNFRGRGFFLELATRTYQLALYRGIVAIVGVANRNSTRLFLEKLGFKDRGMVRWNVDLFMKYSERKTSPLLLHHLSTRTFSIRNKLYLFAYPFIKIYSGGNYSFLSLYLTNRKKKKGIGLTLPQNWFKSNWQVITLNLKPNEIEVEDFLNDFAIDIAESDTF